MPLTLILDTGFLPKFEKELELDRGFYYDIVEPLFRKDFSDLHYSARLSDLLR